MQQPLYPAYITAVIIAIVAIYSVLLYQSFAPDTTDGLWRGHFDINGRGNYEFISLVHSDRLIAFSADARVSYRGQMSIEGDKYRSEMDMYLLNGTLFDSVKLDGTINQDNRITAQFLTQDAQDKGTLILERDDENYIRPMKMDNVAGKWILYEGFTITKFEIKPDGNIHGANTDGCSYDGLVQLPADQYNAFTVDLRISSCHHLDGQYAGLALLLTSLKSDDTLHIQIANDQYGKYLPIVRDLKA